MPGTLNMGSMPQYGNHELFVAYKYRVSMIGSPHAVAKPITMDS